MIGTWKMFAQRRREQDGGLPFFHFGPKGWAAQGEGRGVFEVEVTENVNGDYWAWLDRSGEVPIYISDSYMSFAAAYRAGDMSSDPNYDQTLGQGRIVRLDVREIGAVRS